MAAEKVKRKLTAILSADVKGYSRLMGVDEVGTIRTLETYRRVMSDLIRSKGGRVVDSPGDNVLAEFASVVDALDSAVEIQKELKVRNADFSEGRRMEFRIGINLGDVVQEGKRIYGDGVNIAARIEALAEGGGICISRSAFDQVKNKLNLEYEYLGEHTVKNIAEPVRVYKVMMEPKVVEKTEQGQPKAVSPRSKPVLVGTVSLVVLLLIAGAVWNLTRPAKKVEPTPAPKPAVELQQKASIAVLPFANMSDDREQEFFSDGMTEELIGALAKLEGLKVISRTSVFTFKGKQVDLRTIGEKLGVDHVLEGSVRRAGDKLRITAQLIKVSDDSHLWAETYDRNVKDVFDIQDEISRAVVTRLRVKLLDKGDRKLIQSSTENPQAQDLYFKGLSVWNRREAMKAIEYLEQSISLDPNNARAYALLATVYSRAAFMIPYPPRESYGKAKAAAAKALEIDNMLAEAHIAVGVVKMIYEYDWVGAEKGLIRAIEMNPGLASAHFYYSWYHISLGHTDEAIAEIKRAFELDPLATHVNNHMAFILISARQYEQAIQCCQRALEVNPNDSGAIQFLGLAYAKKGMCEEAISVLQKGVNLFPKDPFIASALGFSYGVAGKRDEAQKIINGFMDISKKKYFSPNFISRVYAGMGEVDKAVDWLEKAYEERDPTFCLIKSVPSHDYMHSDPRFKAILKKMGLAE